MSGILKILRSLTVGNRPSGRSYGEPYVNFPEGQFGVVDNTGAARDLLGVPIFSANMNYSTGNPVNYGGKLYVALGAIAAGAFNSTQWALVTGIASGNRLLLSKQVITTPVSVVPFTSLISAAYDEYVLEVNNLIFSTNGDYLAIQVSQDNGLTWVTGGSSYQVQFVQAVGGPSPGLSGGGSNYQNFWLNSASAINYPNNATLRLFTPMVPGVVGWKALRGEWNGSTAAAFTYELVAGGVVLPNTPYTYNAIQFIAPTGYTFTGTIALYGITK